MATEAKEVKKRAAKNGGVKGPTLRKDVIHTYEFGNDDYWKDKPRVAALAHQLGEEQAHMFALKKSLSNILSAIDAHQKNLDAYNLNRREVLGALGTSDMSVWDKFAALQERIRVQTLALTDGASAASSSNGNGKNVADHPTPEKAPPAAEVMQPKSVWETWTTDDAPVAFVDAARIVEIYATYSGASVGGKDPQIKPPFRHGDAEYVCLMAVYGSDGPSAATAWELVDPLMYEGRMPDRVSAYEGMIAKRGDVQYRLSRPVRFLMVKPPVEPAEKSPEEAVDAELRNV